MSADELLVVDYAPSDQASSWPIASTYPPRISIVHAGPDALGAIATASRAALARRADGGIDAVGDTTAFDELDDGARLFVEAWRSQPPAKPDRPGDGLSWDTPGFKPPDPPSG